MEIPQWQIDQVRERTEKYLKNPSSAQDIDDFLKEIDQSLDGVKNGRVISAIDLKAKIKKWR